MKQPPANSRLRPRRFQRGLLAGMVFFQLLLAGRASALDPDRELSQYNCQTWSRQNGLPASSVNAIAQTKDGYLWFGTAAGLLRFDSIDFKMLDLHAVATVRSSFVTSLAGERSGGLWVGLQNSAFGFYDGRSFTFRGGTNAATAVLDVRTILNGADGTLWVVAAGEVARVNRSGELEPIPITGSNTNVALNNVMCGYEDPRGRLWLGTANQGVYCWQDGKITKLPDPKLDATSVLSIVEDWDGQIWVGTSIGLFCYDASLQRRGYPPIWDEVHALLVDRQGVLWIGTTGHGLARYQHGTYDFLQKADGLGSDYVNAIAEDKEGSLWIGTRDGITQLSDVKFPIQRAAKDPTVKDALAVGPSRRDGVWIASGGGGVARFDPKTKTYTTLSGLPDRYAKRVFEASNGDLYVVSGTGKLVVFSGGKAVATNSTSSMIVGMAEDEQGVVVSVGGDLYRAGTNYFRPYAFTNADKPPFYWILNLASGKNGVIWVASGNGIFRVKDGAYQHWAAAEGLADPVVATVCEDQDGVVWAGLMSGIARLKDNHIRLINRQDGLFDDNIYAIVPDDLGNLWVDSGRGVFRVTRQNLNDFADGKTNHVACTVFDGINSVKVADKTVQERVGCKTTDGRIWFPGPLGVVMIDPANIPVNRVAPPVHIERVRANGKELGRTGQIVVPPGAGDLEFDYDALTFIAPQNEHYRYRLEGYDQAWVDAGDRRLAFYTNLKPGPYTFHVIAANADGVWNETGDTFHAELRPHYYQTAWFRLLCVGLAVAALGGIYLRRIRRLSLERQALEKNRELLESEIQKRTAELAKSNATLQEKIAERRQAEQQITESRNFLVRIINAVPDPIFVKDRQHRELLVNDAFCHLMGFKREELFEKSDHDHDCFASAQADESRSKDELVFTTGKENINEETLTSADGTVHFIITKKALYTDVKGEKFIVGVIQEMTERKRAEQLLRESQALYHSLVNQMAAGVFRKDAEGRYIFVNSSFCRIVELSADEILGKTASELVSGMKVTQANRCPVSDKLGTQGVDHHELIMQTGRQIIVEDEYQGFDGKRSCYHIVKSAVYGAEGKIAGSQGILFDVTEAKDAEAALAYERDLLRSLLDNSPDQIYFKDAQSRFVKTSTSLADKIGAKDADEILGKTDFDFFTDEHACPAFEDEQEIIRTGRPLLGKVEKEILKDGKATWALTNKMPLRNKDGQIIGTFGISKDITDLKQAQEAVAYERDLLRTLLDHSPDSIFFKDLQSRLVNVSRSEAASLFKIALSRHRDTHRGESADQLPAHLASVGRFHEYIIGKTDADFYGSQDVGVFNQDEREIIRTGRPMIGKIEQTVCPDGSSIWHMTTKMPWRNKDGEIIGTFGNSKDISALKNAEAKIEETHKKLLETSRQAGMAEIATNVLHNVGNVLNSVNISASLVVDNVKKSKAASLAKVSAMMREHEHDLGTFITSDAKGRRLPAYLGQLAEQLLADQKAAVQELDLLVKNIEHINEIVSMQQNYARVSGVKEIINVRNLVEDSLRMNAGALAHHHIEIIREFEDVPLINVEKHKFLQILVNLIRNAKHACQDSERVDQRLTVRVASGEGRIKISVSDNGVGIPPENLTRIFNHGFTTRKDGHGFGLHSGALAAKELGGSLTVSSDGPGKGATFTLELPLQPGSTTQVLEP